MEEHKTDEKPETIKEKKPVTEAPEKPAEKPEKPIVEEKPHNRKLVEPETTVDEYFLEQKSIELEKQAVRKRTGMPLAQYEKKKYTFYDKLKIKLSKAGKETEPQDLVRLILHITWILLGVGTAFVGLFSLSARLSILAISVNIVAWWVFGFVFLYSLSVVTANLYLNYLVFKRKLEVEQVLPEFLRLVATNYRSGLPLDEALNKSNRPRFGVLSNEIKIVSKTARVKGDLAKALEIFGKKFDSKILQRAMNNLSMSIRTGSNVSDLLDEIASNITKMRNMRSSMAANVKNYLIFIVIAGVIIAPLMFSMSWHMNNTISNIKGSISDQRAESQSQATVLTNISGEGGMDPKNFDVFAILMILTNSVISGLVISVIRYGNYQQGIKRIPVFLVLSVLIYYIGKGLLGYVMVFV